MNAELFEFSLRLADDRIVLGHRLSEWCGHVPQLEEDIALANIALDLIGQANAFYTLAARIEKKGRSADTLAFLRDANEYKNFQLNELPRGDFAYTVLRQFFFSLYSELLFEGMSPHEGTEGVEAEIIGVAEKSLKESRYHVRHAREWVIRLGDGTEESHTRIASALSELWMYTGELFEDDEVDRAMQAHKIAPLPSSLRAAWMQRVGDVFSLARLEFPPSGSYMARGSRAGLHTEHLGHMLAEMQILQRSHPGASW